MEYAEEKSYPVVSVGPDELDEWDLKEVPDDLKWLVYWYEKGGYDGAGLAIYAATDGTYGEADLNHCSCYGPTDNLDGVGRMSVDELRKRLEVDQHLGHRRVPEDCDYAWWAAVSPPVLKLLASGDQREETSA